MSCTSIDVFTTTIAGKHELDNATKQKQTKYTYKIKNRFDCVYSTLTQAKAKRAKDEKIGRAVYQY